MSYKPRQYQSTALTRITESLRNHPRALLQAATGAGKTFIVCQLVAEYVEKYGIRVLLLMHKKELIEQFLSSFAKFTNITDIGVCCASLNSKDISKQVTIASIQTIANLMGKYPGADLVIIDETHRAGHENGDTQYGQVLQTLQQYVPNCRFLGVTATAYRLGHGMIYGDRCKPDRTNFFPELTHRITYESLKSDGYLLPLRGLVAGKPDLSQVDTSKGEYNIGQASSVMIQHVESCVDALETHAAGHDKVAVFACTIEHAERLNEAFTKRGHKSCVVHSQLLDMERNANLSNWRNGDVRICVSVNVLVEGYDFPQLSCLITARPTKSPVVFIQAIGRPLRTYNDQDHALLIDLAGWVEEFGLDLDNPHFVIPKGNGSGDAPVKICPGEIEGGYACGMQVHPATMECPECGHKWTMEEVEALLPQLKTVVFNEPEPNKTVDVHNMSVMIHNNKILRVMYECSDNVQVSDWICFPDHYTSRGAIEMGKKKWYKYTEDADYPDDVETAAWLAESFDTPDQLILKKDGKYWNVVDTVFKDVILKPDNEFYGGIIYDGTGDDVPF